MDTLTEASKIVVAKNGQVNSRNICGEAPCLSPKSLSQIAGEVAVMLQDPFTSLSSFNLLLLPSATVTRSSTTSGADIGSIYIPAHLAKCHLYVCLVTAQLSYPL